MTLRCELPRLAELLASDKSEEQILEELFLATLTRFPTETEKQHFAAYLEKRKTNAASVTADAPASNGKGAKKSPGKGRTPEESARRAAFADTLWALINTREFILNH